MVHPDGLDFRNQSRVVMLRDIHELPWDEIRLKVVNLRGQHPSRQLCARIYKDFSVGASRRRSKYHLCGRQPWKMAPPIKRFALKRLRVLRTRVVCTSTTLQREISREFGITVETSTIRRALQAEGYRWMARKRKRVYSPKLRAARLAFARVVMRFSAAALRERLSFAMDGVVFTLPPPDPTDRLNFCRHGDTHVWRKKSEAWLPQLGGDDPFAKQAPLSRLVPLWGGVSPGGFAVVCVHERRKITAEEWVAVVRQRKLRNAVLSLNPARKTGVKHVLCDNERFLTTAASTRAMRQAKIRLWHIPPLSPDLNPVEKFWAWMRRALRSMDLADCVAGRPVLTRQQYTARIRAVARSQRAQRAAAACATGLRRVCQEVQRRKGAATRG